jgi:hypothetical protein
VRPEERVLALYVRWRAAGVEERMQTEEVLGRYAAFCAAYERHRHAERQRGERGQDFAAKLS